MWICRDKKDKALALYRSKPIKNGSFFNEYDEEGDKRIWIDRKYFPEVTFENSPMEVELKVKHSGMHLSPMFRLLDMIVIKDPSDRKRIVAYTKKLIDKLKEEGFDADARVAEEYLKMFNGESIAMATMD